MKKDEKNIFLREVQPSDLEILLFWENNPENWKVSGTMKPYTTEEMLSFVNDTSYLAENGQQRWLICLYEDQQAIGTIDVFNVDLIHGFAGIGILIAEKEMRHKGFATQALELLIELAENELNLTNLTCSIQSDNDSSIQLFKKVGFEEIGIRKDWYLHNGIRLDEHLFQLCLKK